MLATPDREPLRGFSVYPVSGQGMEQGPDAPCNWCCWRQEGLMTLPFWFDRFLWLMLIVVAISGMVLIG